MSVIGEEHIDLFRTLSTMLEGERESCTEHGELRLDFLIALKEYIEAKVREANNPEILGALKELVFATEVADNPKEMGICQDSQVMLRARAAIAKAEGK